MDRAYVVDEKAQNGVDTTSTTRRGGTVTLTTAETLAERTGAEAPGAERIGTERTGTERTAPVPPAVLTELAALAHGLAGEFRLRPLLEKMLVNAVALLECSSGSICTIDEEHAVYRKEVDLGVDCHAGEVFPLDEGVTGAVVLHGDVVAFDRYSLVPCGHIPPSDARHDCPVIGVPLTHDGRMIGAFIIFGSPAGRPFTSADAELLALFATHASIAIVNSRAHAEEVDRAVAEALKPAPDARLTEREQQVHSLVVCGLPDKLIASQLGIAVKTVEKHVSTILRKTGARNRTMLAARQGEYRGNPA